MEKFGLKINEQGFKISGTGMGGLDVERAPWNQPDAGIQDVPKAPPVSQKADVSVDSKSRGAEVLKWDADLDIEKNFKVDDQSFDGEIEIFKKAVFGQESKGVRGKDGNIIDPYKVKGIQVWEHGYDGDYARGKYQIMGKHWPKWAKEAGLPENAWDPDAGMSPTNQEYVATFKMNQYYNQFGGDWRKVAIAWYSGPKGMEKKVKNYDPVYHKGQKKAFPSIAEYGDSILDKMKKV